MHTISPMLDEAAIRPKLVRLDSDFLANDFSKLYTAQVIAPRIKTFV